MERANGHVRPGMRSVAIAGLVGWLLLGGVLGAVRAAAPDDLAARVAAAQRPNNDPLAIARRLGGSGPTGPVSPPSLTTADVGRTDRFHVLDQTRKPNVQYDVDAELRLVSPHAYWYVERGRTVDDAALAASGAQYEQAIYPLVQRLVGAGHEVGPITLLHAQVPGVIGYFSSGDLFPRWVVAYSNERPMVYLDPGTLRAGSVGYGHTLSHELTHLFHYMVNVGEDTWLKEGLGELAQELVDPDYRYPVYAFLQRPGTGLTAWADAPNERTLHYQAGYLFLRYLIDRFGGPETLPHLLQSGQRGAASVDTYLSALGRPERFADVFRDWTVANVVQDRAVADGRYGYGRALDGRPRAVPVAAPQQAEGRVAQFGSDYYALQGPSSVRVRFQGAPTVPVLETAPPGDAPFWWSHRGDMMETRLTRDFDLTGTASATLAFDLRYDTEEDYDYGYVLASTDGGARWQLLSGRYTTRDNPTGRNLGAGYNGRSGDDGSWVREEIDLSPFAGQRVQIRFAYVTDDSYNAEGVAVANLAVRELGWRDDGSGWTSEGWVWVDSPLPQPFAVQVVEYRGEQPTVRELPLTGTSGEIVLGESGDVTRAVVVVSGLAPATLQPARYTIAFEPAP